MFFWEILLIIIITFLVCGVVICLSVYCCKSKKSTPPLVVRPITTHQSYINQPSNSNVYVTTSRQYYYPNENHSPHQTGPVYTITNPCNSHIINNQHQQQQLLIEDQRTEMPPSYDEIIIQKPLRTRIQHY